MANINKRMKKNIESNKLAHADELTALEQKRRSDKKKYSIKYTIKAAIIAAMYVGLTFAFFGISFEIVQFRISEILTALIFFEPAAFPGLCVGCFIANVLGPGGFYDAVLGTCATGFGLYIITWYCGHNGKAPIGLLLYAFFNAFMVSLELSYSTGISGADKGMLWIFMWVMIGEAVTAVGGGSALYYLLKKRWKDIVGETKKSEEQEFTPTTLQ